MVRKFMPAAEAIKITEEHERNSKEAAKEKAVQVLEEFEFDRKVREAAEKKQWKIRDPLFIEDYDVAVAVCDILKELGYTARPDQHGYGVKCYRIIIGWSQTLVRAAAGEKR